MDNIAVWAAHGQRYLQESCDSCESLVRSNSLVRTVLITIEEERKGQIEFDAIFDEIIYLDVPLEVRGYYFKLWALNSIDYERFIFLDSDTLVLGNVNSLFDCTSITGLACVPDPLVDTFAHVNELASPENWLSSDLFGEINTGVLCVNKRLLGLGFFELVMEFHKQLMANNRHYVEGLVPDQPAFYQAILASQLYPLFLGSEYNFRNCYPQITSQPIKIVHGHRSLTGAHFKGGGKKNDVTIFFPWGMKFDRRGAVNRTLFFIYRIVRQFI
jgi:hypothetical protein